MGKPMGGGVWDPGILAEKDVEKSFSHGNEKPKKGDVDHNYLTKFK